jgi:hypothetical protein
VARCSASVAQRSPSSARSRCTSLPNSGGRLAAAAVPRHPGDLDGGPGARDPPLLDLPLGVLGGNDDGLVDVGVRCSAGVRDAMSLSPSLIDLLDPSDYLPDTCWIALTLPSVRSPIASPRLAPLAFRLRA